ITKEAAKLYLQKTTPKGMVVFHISSRSFNLRHEVGQLADAIGIPAYATISPLGEVEGTEYVYNESEVVALTKNQDYIESLKKLGWSETHGIEGRQPWTDTYVNPLRSVNFNAFRQRGATSSPKNE
ncbi:MAG TPA: hypothetical protein PKH37_06490, partial [Alphaproteobacteria bacterium]|nr:hypothetical protein [Alphaproteobacteria bacterium]